jgi:hypothetical protein
VGTVDPRAAVGRVWVQLSSPIYQGHDVVEKTQIKKYKQNIDVATNNKHLEA